MRANLLIAIGTGVASLAGLFAVIQTTKSGSFFALWGWVCIGLGCLAALFLIVGAIAGLTGRGDDDEAGTKQIVHATAPAAATAFQGVQTLIIGDQDLVNRALQSYEEKLSEISHQREERFFERLEEKAAGLLEETFARIRSEQPEALERPELPERVGGAMAGALSDQPTSDSKVVDDVFAAAVGEPPALAGSLRRVMLRTLLAMVVLVVVGAAAFAGFRIAHRPTVVRVDRIAAAQGIRLKYWSNWKEVASSPTLLLPQTIVISPGTAPSEVFAGVTSTTPPTFLPSAFLRDVKQAKPQYVRVGRRAVLRYAGLRQNGFSRALTLYVAPLRQGRSAIVGCAGIAPLACGAIVQTMSFTEPTLDPRPSAAFATQLNAVFASLAPRRSSELSQFAAAKTSPQQAADARKLSAQYAAAASQLEKAHCPQLASTACADLASALRNETNSLAALATSAKAQKASAYKSAVSGIHRADSGVNAAITAFRSLGYKVSTG